MKKILSLCLVFCVALMAYGQKTYQLTSPNGEIKVSVKIADQIYYDIAYGQETLLEKGTMKLQVGDQWLGEKPRVAKSSTQSVDEDIHPVIPFKFSTIRNQYNQLLLKFSGNYSVEFRAFDDGVAYRFLTNKRGEIEVTDELFQVDFPADYQMHIQRSGGFGTNYELYYEHPKYSEWKDKKGVTLLPMLLEAKNNYKILISESAITDYPHMFMAPAGNHGLSSALPKCPIEFGENGDRSLKLVKHADYIAKTSGKRGFPWRYFVITKEDGQLIENTMTARLAEPKQIEDTSWIKPGLTTWEWWNGATPYGTDVDFETGCNTATYKYYLDFAAKHGVEYILLDEGWAKSTY
ncbi:MAG: glycoside hydrolase family 97 N-terminal domain-containing protein, partial [Bacteroidaceae bacterium]|nr:glycoside hydrolase family 97 N-terminal domain-containing protein [Bacteroidaceae bacterium]